MGVALPAASYDGPTDSPPELRRSPGLLRVVQKSGTTITYYARVEPGSVLTFGLGSREKGQPTPEYSVSVRESNERPPVRLFQDGRFRRLLRFVRLQSAVRVSLPEVSGFLQVSLHVGSSRPDPTTGVWLNPRIEGPSSSAAPGAGDAEPENAVLRPAMKDLNFVMICLDAARADQFGCCGSKVGATPSADQMAQHGVVFLNAQCEAVFTQASTGSLFTSQYPDQHGSYKKEYGLGPDSKSWVQSLQSAGWETAMITSSPNASSLYGYDRGFKTVRELYKQASKRGPRLVDADEVVDSAMEWIEGQAGQKFMAYLHVREPHAPVRPPPPFYGTFTAAYNGPLKNNNSTENLYELASSGKMFMSSEDRAYMLARYDENLAFADSQVGRLISFLSGKGLLDRTVVIVSGDHGEAQGEHGFWGHNAFVYDEISHPILVMRLPPSLLAKRRAIEEPVGIIDIGPTVLAMAGVTPIGIDLRGRNLLPAIAEGRPLKPIPLYVRTAGDAPAYGMLDGGYFYINDPLRSRKELFRESDDPRQHKNLIDEEPLRAGYMHQAIEIWRREQLRLAESAPAAQITATAEDVSALIGLGYASPIQGAGDDVTLEDHKGAAKPEQKKSQPAVTKPTKTGPKKPDALRRHEMPDSERKTPRRRRTQTSPSEPEQPPNR